MATAEFDAEYVYDAAVKKIRKIRDWQAAEREAAIDKFVTYRGGFFWLQTKTRTRDEATRKYEVRDPGNGNCAAWVEMPWGRQVEQQIEIARIARAAINTSVKGRVTLTAGDCRAIGIPAAFEVPA